MDMPRFHENPNRSLQCTPPPERPAKRKIPPAILEMVSALGLRYAPSGAADRDTHAAKFALLADDLADVDPAKLRVAIDRWVSFKPFPPKASELLAIIDGPDYKAPVLPAIALELLALLGDDLVELAGDVVVDAAEVEAVEQRARQS